MIDKHPALETGQALIQAIKKEDWQSLTEISSYRDNLITSDTELSETSIREILAQNKVIQSVLHQQKRDLADRFAKLGQARSAHAAYESNRV